MSELDSSRASASKIKTYSQKNKWISENLSYRKDTGSRAWILHRITGLALIGYLFLHIYSLSPLTQGREAFDNSIKMYTTPFFMVLEWFLFAFVLFHSLNGIRIVLVDWADGARYHRQLYWISWVAGILMFLAMGALMFSHEIKGLFQ